MTAIRLILLLILCGLEMTSAQTAEDVTSLYDKLFVHQAYNKRVRPTEDQTFPTEIFVDFHLLAINEVNTVEETLTLTAFLNVQWEDQHLIWDPEDYGDISFYHSPQGREDDDCVILELPDYNSLNGLQNGRKVVDVDRNSVQHKIFRQRDEVWKPVIALRNSYLDYKALGDKSLDVLNEASGTITWMPFQVFTSTCSMNVKYYPFDIQTCELRFVAWGYTKDEIHILVGSLGLDLDEYEPNARWDLVSTSWREEDSPVDVSVVFVLKLRRLPGYALFTILLPILLLTILNIFVFVLPCESGERVGYAVTVFLSFAVFFTLISGVLPESISLFTIYVIVMTSQSALICLIAIAEVKLSFRDEHEHTVPRWLTVIANVGQCQCFGFNKCTRKVASRSSTPVKTINNDNTDMALQDVDSDGTIDPMPYSIEKETWKNTVIGIDNILILLFSLFSLLATVIVMSICAKS